MKREKQNASVLISSSSKKLLSFVDGLRNHKLTQQKKLAQMKECVFVINI